MDYRFDFAPMLDAGDAVADITVTVPAGITLVSSALMGSNVALALLSGGTPGVEYMIEFSASTLFGYTLVQYAILPVVAAI